MEPDATRGSGLSVCLTNKQAQLRFGLRPYQHQKDDHACQPGSCITACIL